MKKVMYACRLFDPFFVQENNIATLSLLVDELKHFGKGFPEFVDDDFKIALKSELHALKAMSTVAFDWNGIEEAKQYEMRKLKKKHREQKRATLRQINGLENVEGLTIGRSQDYDDWKNDPGELARRIVGWWQSMSQRNPTKISIFVQSLVLVVLVQTSSCSVERTFSRVQFIRRACGPRMLESTLEL